MHPLFILACIINFLFWLYISRTNTLVTCPKIKTSLASSSSTADIKSELCPPSTHSCNPPSRDASGIDLSYYNTKYLLKYRDKLLGKLEYPEESLIVNPYAGTECIKTVQAQSSLQEDAYLVTDCMVVAFVSSQHSYNSIRFNAHWKLRRRLYSRNMEPGGFFKVPGHHNGRAQLVKKMGPFVEHILQIEDYIWFKLVERGLVSGDKDEKDASGHRVRNRGDLVVMVVNEGEMDLLANFACSCERFGVSMKNMLVFTPNAHLIPLIEALGPVGLYHKSFAFAPHSASVEYLDQTFVDMMWYKCFSVYVTLRLGFNTLFQDVDLVWFKDPFPRLHEIIEKSPGLTSDPTSAVGKLDAIFTDDGQRGIRYTPFFSNSGLYYLVSSPRTEYFAWTVMSLFDLLQRTGSHQNVVALRLMEAYDFSGLVPYLLSPREFPNGDAFHHDPAYMEELRAKLVHPYSFHMCWTLNKEEKLRNFKLVNMWYLDEPADSANTCKVYREYSALAAPLAAELEGQRQEEAGKSGKRKKNKKGAEDDEGDEEGEEE